MPRLSRKPTRMPIPMPIAATVTAAFLMAAPLSAQASMTEVSITPAAVDPLSGGPALADHARLAGPVALTTAELDDVAGGRNGWRAILRYLQQTNTASVNQNTVVIAPAISIAISFGGTAVSIASSSGLASVLASLSQSNTSGT